MPCSGPGPRSASSWLRIAYLAIACAGAVAVWNDLARPHLFTSIFALPVGWTSISMLKLAQGRGDVAYWWTYALGNLSGLSVVLLVYELERIRLRVDHTADLAGMFGWVFIPPILANLFGYAVAALARRHALRQGADTPP